MVRILYLESFLRKYEIEDIIHFDNKIGQNINMLKRKALNIIILYINRRSKTFQSPDFDKMKSLMKNPVIFDGRNLFRSSNMQQEGFEYSGIGQGFISSDFVES